MGSRYAFPCVISLICLAGCGTPSQIKLVAFGNSITLHLPDASIGWSGVWGMAASAQAKDYAHVTAAAMNLKVIAMNVGGVESGSNGPDLKAVASAGIDPKTIVIVELGDNVPDSDSGVLYFAASYDTLLNAMPSHLKLVCVSTFWERPSVDAVIKYQCDTHGGLYTYIGDIYTDPNNPDRKVQEYPNPGVNMHPHDWGMAHISSRILAEVNPGK
jgi:alpha-galactosidase